MLHTFFPKEFFTLIGKSVKHIFVEVPKKWITPPKKNKEEKTKILHKRGKKA